MQHHILQKDLAKLLAVDKNTIQNWERGIGKPMIRHVPGIIKLLGYDPEPAPQSLGQKIAYSRRLLGFTQEDLGKALAIGSFAVWQWESGRAVPPQDKLQHLQSLLEERQIVGITLQLS
jgi:DNA-binding transcriptional regulator YiaG